MAFVGPLVAPYGFESQDIAARLKPPGRAHFFGTDQYGRDIFSRILVGSRGIFLLGGTGTLLAAVIGTTIGLFSGYYGRMFDELLMRILDILLAFPPLLLALVLLATVGSSLTNLIAVITILYVPMLARVVRSMVLDLKTKEFVEAARTRGKKTPISCFAKSCPTRWHRCWWKCPCAFPTPFSWWPPWGFWVWGSSLPRRTGVCRSMRPGPIFLRPPGCCSFRPAPFRCWSLPPT